MLGFVIKLVLLIIIVAVLLFAWACKTQIGTRSLLTLVEDLSIGSLHFKGVTGSLGDQLKVDEFIYTSKALHIKASAVELDWYPGSLWQKHVEINRLSISSLLIAGLPSNKPATMPGDLSLPVSLQAKQLALGRLVLGELHADGKTMTETLQLSAMSGKFGYQGTQFQASATGVTPWGRVEATSKMGSQTPFKLEGNASMQALSRPELPAFTAGMAVQGKVSGSLAQFQLALQTELGRQATASSERSQQVMQGKANAVITPFKAPFITALQIDASHVDPSVWQAGAPQADLRVLAQLNPVNTAASTNTSFGLTGNVSISNAKAGPVNQRGLPVQNLDTSLLWQGEQIQLSKVQVQLAGRGKLQGDARVQWPGGKLQAELDVNLANIDLKQIDQRLRSSDIQGKFSAHTAKDHSINMQAHLRDARASLQAEASYRHDKQLLSFSKIDLQAEQTQLQGAGDISFAGQQLFHVKANLKDFDPARWVDTQPGRLQAELTAQGQLHPRLLLEAKLTQLQGQYAGQSVQGLADIRWQQDRQLQVRQLDVNWGNNSLSAEGNWGQPDDVLKLRLDAQDVSRLNPLLSHWQLAVGGSIKADASLRGSFNEPAGSVDTQAQQISIKRGKQVFSIASLQGRLNLANGLQGQFDGDITASKLSTDWPGTDTASATNTANTNAKRSDKLEQMHLQLKGRRDAHTLTLDTTFSNQQVLKLTATGSLQSSPANPWAWNGQLQTLSLNGKPDVHLQSAVSMQVSAHAVKLGALNLQSELGKLQLEELEWTPASIKTRGQLSDVRALDIMDLVRPQYAVSGNLRLNAQWNLNLQDSAQGEIRVQRQSGDLRFNDPEGTGTSVALGIRELALQVKLGGLVAGSDGENLALDLKADGSRLGLWQVKLNSQVGKQNDAWTISKTAALSGQGSASIPDLQWLGPLINPGLVLKGRLNINGQLQGSLGQPHYRADLSGRELEVAFASEGLLLPNGSLDAQIEDQRLKVSKLEFSNTVISVPRHAQFQGLDMMGKKGQFTASGDIDIGKETGSIQAQWQQFPLLQRKDRWLVVSGQANIVEANQIWSLTGKVAADGAYFKLPKLPPPSLSSDVVVIRKSDKSGKTVDGMANSASETDSNRKGLKTRVDVSFDMGPRFVFVGRGLDTGLEGSLRLRSADGSPLQANGSIRTVKGVYEGYGQQLAIERGILNFQGPPANPGLNIRALRRGLPVEAGVEIVGTVVAPQVRLVSEPVVPDSEKLSWLVLGRSSDQLASGDASLLMSAATAIFGGDGSRNVPRDIVQGLGFDEFSIGSSSSSNGTRLPGQTVAGSTGTSNSASTDQVVSVGKRIMPGLVLSVERGLSDASGAIKLSWQLTRRISIIGRTGNESAVDVNYTFSFN